MNIVVLSSIIFVGVAFALIIAYYAKRKTCSSFCVDMTSNCKKRRKGDRGLNLHYSSDEDYSSSEEYTKNK